MKYSVLGDICVLLVYWDIWEHLLVGLFRVHLFIDAEFVCVICLFIYT